ncbi:hypothetical protein KGQ20_13920 [Catenulispora sp. NF23]|uniref:hypothetical protein n=1 Tax=Catenulispora pinistramenti TaxID=2705254 RepID=UPI001BA724A3|nr:hypothetical protein [Catenulispora pinistramenti]MBS2533866.1 hypothetical protein [Catenulispora pinistramenti]
MAPFPLPRLTLTAAVHEDDRSKVTFTVTNAKGHVAEIDTGDRHGRLDIDLDESHSGTATYTYPDAGHHTYTATVGAPLDLWRFTAWVLVPKPDPGEDVANWAQMPEKLATWGDADMRTEVADTTVTVDVGDATIFAHVETGADGFPLVAVDVWIGLPPDQVASWTVTRLPETPSQPDLPIWLDVDHPSGASIEDHEAPLRVPLRYLLTLTKADGTTEEFTSNPVAIDTVTGCLLTAVDTGRTVRVTVQSWTETTRDARSVRLAVINRPDPVVVSDTRLLERGTIVFRTHDQDSLMAFRDLMDSPILLLRTQPASALETRYLAPGDHTEGRMFPEDGKSWVRQHQVPYQQVFPPSPSARQNSSTWAQLAGAYLTWRQVPKSLPTWADVRAWRPR